MIFTRLDGTLSKAVLNPLTGMIQVFDWWEHYGVVGHIHSVWTCEDFLKTYGGLPGQSGEKPN